MDNNISCIEFLIVLYNWSIYDIEDHNMQQRPVYIEMQPMTSRIYPTTCNQGWAKPSPVRPRFSISSGSKWRIPYKININFIVNFIDSRSG